MRNLFYLGIFLRNMEIKTISKDPVQRFDFEVTGANFSLQNSQLKFSCVTTSDKVVTNPYVFLIYSRHPSSPNGKKDSPPLFIPLYMGRRACTVLHTGSYQ